MRKRYYLSFDMDDPRHREAETLISNRGSRQRTECVVSGMLAAKQVGDIEQIVRQAIRDEMKSFVRLPVPKMVPEEMPDEVRLTDLPDSLVRALDEM